MKYYMELNGSLNGGNIAKIFEKQIWFPNNPNSEESLKFLQENIVKVPLWKVSSKKFLFKMSTQLIFEGKVRFWSSTSE